MSQKNSSNYASAVEEIAENRKQITAFDSGGHCVVLAGPGSGKTKILTLKLSRLLREEVKPPRNVACLTYSNQCARELKNRLRQLGANNSNNIFVGTVHSFCYREIVIPFGTLAGLDLPPDLPVALGAEVDKIFADSFCSIHSGESSEYKKVPFDEFRRTVLDRNSDEWLEDEYYRPVVEEYEGRLKESGKIDFDGMVLTALKLVQEHEWIRLALSAKFPVLAIDEYQDLGMPLHLLVDSLCFNADIRLFAVGDPDQSIYGFTGARPNLLNELSERENVEKVRLDLNYRCGKSIIKASTALLQQEFDFESASGHEGVIYNLRCNDGFAGQVKVIFESLLPTVLESGTPLGSVGILYANQYDGQVVANTASDYKYNFVRFDQGNPYPRTPLIDWLEDCASWCAGDWETGDIPLPELIAGLKGFNPSLTDADADTLEQQFITFLMSSRDPAIRVQIWMESAKEMGLFDNFKLEATLVDELVALRDLYEIVKQDGLFEEFTLKIFGEQNGSPNHLNLSTLHSSKGLEYDVVFMVGLEEGKVPRTYRSTEASIAENRRLFYVGVTRAKHEVHLLWSGFYQNKWGTRYSEGRSRFIDEIYEKLES